MSWSVAAIGKVTAVRAELERQFASLSKCVEPEETVKQNVRSSLASALSGFKDDFAVKVGASGSQQKDYSDPKNPVAMSNSLNVSVEPIWNFVE